MICRKQKGHLQKHIIKTVSDNQEQIIQWIMDLYCPDGFDVDPTYSKGVFYKKIKQPKFKFDIEPKHPDIVQLDVSDLNLEHVGGTLVKSIMFDPPFVGGHVKAGKDGIIKKRFGCYKKIYDLWNMYRNALQAFYSILDDKGILVFKCQDSVEDHKQFLSHVEIINDAIQMGFYPKDIFILTAKNRIIGKTHRNQQHARKYHSYFIVFEKSECKVGYTIKEL